MNLRSKVRTQLFKEYRRQFPAAPRHALKRAARLGEHVAWAKRDRTLYSNDLPIPATTARANQSL